MDHRLVIARWDEDVTWAAPYPHIIYDKGGAPLAPDGLNIVRLDENPEGHETHTYLSHIIQHYDQLDDWTAFVQGMPFDHANRWDYEWCAEPESGFAWIGHWLAEDVGNGLPHHMRRLPVAEAYHEIFSHDGPPIYRFIAGAQFVTSREKLRGKPLEFWQRVQALGFDPRFEPDWGYTCERLWGYLIDEQL